MAKENVVKAIKDLGWTYIGLTKSFKGAVQQYGSVAICFNMEEAFIVKDAQGLFGAKDLEKGIIKAKDIDIDDTGEIEGVQIVAWFDEDEEEVIFNEELMEELGINDFSVIDSLKTRLTALYKLTELKAITAN